MSRTVIYMIPYFHLLMFYAFAVLLL